jgi:hypothetical protein
MHAQAQTARTRRAGGSYAAEPHGAPERATREVSTNARCTIKQLLSCRLASAGLHADTRVPRAAVSSAGAAWVVSCITLKKQATQEKLNYTALHATTSRRPLPQQSRHKTLAAKIDRKVQLKL